MYLTNCMMRIILLSGAIAILATLTGCSGSGNSSAEAPALLTVRYHCAEGQEVIVDYDNSDPDKSVAYVQLSPENPEKVRMNITISASGARYTDGKLVWWTKGKTAFLTEADQDNEPLYKDCNEFSETE